jgi:hypothetical protein
VLQIIKLPIRLSQPIPWDEIKALQSLSTLGAQTTIPKVLLRLPATSPQKPQDGKRKYVEISAEEEVVQVKEEYTDEHIVRYLVPRFASGCHNPCLPQPPPEIRRGRSATKSLKAGPSTKARSTSFEDEIEVDDSPDSRCIEERCTVCIRNRYPVCLKTGAQGTCSTCVIGKKRCSLRERVNAYWKSIGKIGRRSLSRSRSRAPSERKRSRRHFFTYVVLPDAHVQLASEPPTRKKSVARSVAAESADPAESTDRRYFITRN